MDSLVLVVGVKECQKTLTLQWLVERHRQRGHVFLIPDTMGHWTRRPGIYLTHEDDGEAIAEHAIWLTDRLGCGLTIVWDEAWKFFNRENPPKKKGALSSLLRTGRQPKAYAPWRRRFPVAQILATQQPKDLIPGVRNLTTRIYIGRMFGPEDLEWILSATQDAALVAKLPRLAPGEFIVVTL